MKLNMLICIARMANSIMIRKYKRFFLMDKLLGVRVETFFGGVKKSDPVKTCIKNNFF